MKNNQRGFGAVESLLILVIVGLLSFVGWFVWHSKNQSNKILSNTSQANQSIKSSQDYLTVKEWQVKLPTSSDLHITYTYQKISSTISYSIFSSDELAKITGHPSCHDNGWRIYRGLANDVYDQNNPVKPSYITAYNDKIADFKNIKIGDYYYINPGGGQSCVYPDNADLKLKEDAARNKLRNAIESMVAT